MAAYLIEGFSLGLTLAGSCLATCGPIYAPVLLLEKRTLTKNFLIVLEITTGRFFTYALFGALAGYLGQQLPDQYREWLTAVSYLILAVVLLFMLRPGRKINHSGCAQKKMAMSAKRFPFWLGVITGINVCPSFLLALSSAVDIAGIWQGMLFFTAFFAGTTLVILPLAFLGFLPRWRLDLVKKIGIILTIPVAIWFGYRGTVKLIELLIPSKLVAYTEAPDLFILGNRQTDSLVVKLAERLRQNGKSKVHVIQTESERLPDSLLLPETHLLRILNRIDKPFSQDSLKKTAESSKIYLLDFQLPAEYDSDYADSIYAYLDFYRFKVKNKGFYFNFGNH